MTKSKSTSIEGNRLRQRAGKILSERPKNPQKMSNQDVKRLIQELHVHQIELEMQNEELRRVQVEIEESQSKLIDLYDFAPVGYFTFSQSGQIKDVNLTGARLLGVERCLLTNRKFSAFIAPEFRSFFGSHCSEISKKGTSETCELKLLKKDGMPFYALLESIPVMNGDRGLTQIRSSMTDITERKEAEEALRKSERQCRSLSAQLLTVQENERQRIAAELHDGIGQALTTIRIRVENALQQIGDRMETKPLQMVIPAIQQSIEEIRRMQANLRPSILDDLGILPAISWFCREYQTTYPHIRVEKQIEVEEQNIPDSLRTVTYRILQEAMNNVAKHSKANGVRLSLKKNDNTLELAIQGNGHGFEPEKVLSLESSKRGLGLVSMGERARLSGGSFAIESTKGAGTTVRASWPI
jgi:PAS domain S-box-containing protein